LAEGISRHPSIQAVTWVFVAAVGQVYSENCKEKAEQKGLKTCRAKKSIVVEEIRAIKKSQVLCIVTVRKMHWRTFHESARPHPSHAEAYKIVNSFKKTVP
jgi:hypothetical protein